MRQSAWIFVDGVELDLLKADIPDSFPLHSGHQTRGAAGMLNLGNLNLYNEETCIGLPYLFEFLNLFTFIYVFISDHRGR